MARTHELYVPPALVEVGDFRNRTLGTPKGWCRDYGGWGWAWICVW